MIKILLFIVFLLFSIVGICDFIYILRMFFCYPNIYTKNYAFIVLKDGKAIRQLNYIWQRIRWNGDAFAVGIIAVIDQLNVKEVLLCNEFSKNKNIILCTASTVSKCNFLQGELIDENRK